MGSRVALAGTRPAERGPGSQSREPKAPTPSLGSRLGSAGRHRPAADGGRWRSAGRPPAADGYPVSGRRLFPQEQKASAPGRRPKGRFHSVGGVRGGHPKFREKPGYPGTPTPTPPDRRRQKNKIRAVGRQVRKGKRKEKKNESRWDTSNTFPPSPARGKGNVLDVGVPDFFPISSSTRSVRR